MPFNIPNVADAEDVSQAQPDSRDFKDILVPAFAGTGVVSGCAVIAQGTPNMTVAVAGGSVAVGGTTVGVTGGNVTITAAHATLARFDLICVDGAGTKSAVAGTPAANPVFPDPAGKAVLAAVRVPATVTFITNAKITDKRVAPAATSAQLTPAGAITAFAGSTAPTGWLLCDGAAVNRSTYSVLFALIGTTYGIGDGSTTFNVPDIRGRVIAGLGTHADVNALGKNDGQVTVATRRVKHAHTNGLLLPNHIHSHNLTLPTHIHNTSLTLPNHSHGHSLTLPNHIHNQALTLPNHIHGHALSLPNHIHGHGLTLPNHIHNHALQLPDHAHANTINFVDTGHSHGGTFWRQGAGSQAMSVVSASDGWSGVDPGAAALSKSGSVTGVTSFPTIGGAIQNPSTLPGIDGAIQNNTTNPLVGGAIQDPTTNPTVGGAIQNPTTLPPIGGTVDNPTTNPTIGGAIQAPTTFPAIDNGILNPTTLPAPTGTIGDPGMTDSEGYIVLNYIIKA